MHPKDISISDFTYHLPEEKIAAFPLAKRDDSKLLVYKNGEIQESCYNKIPEFIPPGSLMVFNNTRVVEARLLFEKDTGGVIEIFCLEPHEKYMDIAGAMARTGRVLWLCLVGGASKWKRGLVLKKEVAVNNKKIILSAAYIEKRAGCFVIELVWNDDHVSFAELLHYAGKVPLPPYIKRNVEADDSIRYQTVYASYDGSVAAPTAGLHFTSGVFEELKKKEVDTAFVTLHVGAGTFKPVKAETMQGHEMHAEFIEVNKECIQQLIDGINKNIVAVGTTSLRTIESLYWLGCKLLLNKNVFEDGVPSLAQWEPYDLEMQQFSVPDALNMLAVFLENTSRKTLIAKTQIIIAPGYRFKIANGLVTNFHQPSSTLLLLVAAFIGSAWKQVYHYALQNNFRFLSYGDGNLLWR